MEPVLLKHIDHPESHTMKYYLSHGGYGGAKKAMKMDSEKIIEIVLDSGLRGRGGAGFPAGKKWSFVPKDPDKPVYFIANADESEPGTFKDRCLIEKDPHSLIEGIIIGCKAVNSHIGYIYIRGEMALGAKRLEQAINEAREKGFLGKNIFKSDYHLNLYVVRGAGAYICGEETALLTSLEGKRGYPKLKPPFPAVKGVFASPTVVNNVETLCCLPHIILNGADWFRGYGTEKSPGFKIFSVSGHIKNPGNYELPLGFNLKELIYDVCGGLWKDRPLKAVIPGGSSVQVLTANEIDISLDFESVMAAGSMLGSGAVTVMDDSVCMVDACWNIMRFYAHESCGQCTPCREGLPWIAKIMRRIEEGEGSAEDIDLLMELSESIPGRTICVLADAACFPLKSYLIKFKDEFDEHIRLGRCPMKG